MVLGLGVLLGLDVLLGMDELLIVADADVVPLFAVLMINELEG